MKEGSRTRVEGSCDVLCERDLRKRSEEWGRGVVGRTPTRLLRRKDERQRSFCHNFTGDKNTYRHCIRVHLTVNGIKEVPGITSVPSLDRS